MGPQSTQFRGRQENQGFSTLKNALTKDLQTKPGPFGMDGMDGMDCEEA